MNIDITYIYIYTSKSSTLEIDDFQPQNDWGNGAIKDFPTFQPRNLFLTLVTTQKQPDTGTVRRAKTESRSEREERLKIQDETERRGRRGEDVA